MGYYSDFRKFRGLSPGPRRSWQCHDAAHASSVFRAATRMSTSPSGSQRGSISSTLGQENPGELCDDRPRAVLVLQRKLAKVFLWIEVQEHFAFTISNEQLCRRPLATGIRRQAASRIPALIDAKHDDRGFESVDRCWSWQRSGKPEGTPERLEQLGAIGTGTPFESGLCNRERVLCCGAYHDLERAGSWCLFSLAEITRCAIWRHIKGRQLELDGRQGLCLSRSGRRTNRWIDRQGPIARQAHQQEAMDRKMSRSHLKQRQTPGDNARDPKRRPAHPGSIPSP